jgi:hypothetical protein
MVTMVMRKHHHLRLYVHYLVKTKVGSVYCAVRTGYSDKTHYVLFLKG